MNIINSIYILLAGIFWGSMGLFVHVLTDTFGFSSIQGAVLRITSCALILFVFLLVYNKKLLKISVRDIPILALNGLISVLLMTVFYFSSISSDTSMSISAVLLYTAPFIVMFLSCIFFKEKITFQKIVALIIAFAGCCLVSLTEPGYSTPSGIILALLSAVAYALYSIFGSMALKRNLEPFTVTFYSFLFASLGCIVIFFVTDMPKKISGVENLPVFALAVFATGLITAVLPFVLYTKGLSGTSPAKASIMAYIEPISACVFGYFRGESMTALMILGICLTLASIVFLNIKIPHLSGKDKQ
ncbi:MAG: EamA family transporter [Clostridia bacterium]|nr:EamA family transporter [Clostridia bacterium]